MKRHILYSGSIIFASMIIAAAIAFARRPVRGQSDSEQIKELNARIGHLETNAAALQKELGQVHNQKPTVIYTPANEIIPAPTTGPTPAQIPPGWKPFEFNGLTYYFTPLGNGTQLSAPAPTKVEIISGESVAAK